LTETVAITSTRGPNRLRKEKLAWLSLAAPKKRAAAVRVAAIIFMVFPPFRGLATSKLGRLLCNVALQNRVRDQ
jgi:hypothetical protein